MLNESLSGQLMRQEESQHVAIFISYNPRIVRLDGTALLLATADEQQMVLVVG